MEPPALPCPSPPFAALPYPFMPPFVGTDEEAEALAAYLSSLGSDVGPASADQGGA